MSGSAALASARRRRAIPQKPENEVIEPPKLSQPSQPQPGQQSVTVNPTTLLIKHNQVLGGLQTDIEDLKKQLNNIKVPDTSTNDKNNVEYYKNQHNVLLDEMREVKKTLLKVQSFAMETNLELMKLKRTMKPIDEQVELPASIEN
jgi:hypothetical protein